MANSSVKGDEGFEWGNEIADRDGYTMYKWYKYMGVTYSMYDSVFTFTRGAKNTDIGKITMIWETTNKEKKVKLLWYFRPADILNFLGDYRPNWNELFLASGNGKGLHTVVPLDFEDISMRALKKEFEIIILTNEQSLIARKATLEPSLVEAENAVEVIKVMKDGSGKFKTITEAVKSIDVGNTNRVIILIGPGEYVEKVTIERFKPYITLYGADPKNMPIISFAGTAAKYGTVDSATLIVESDYFVAVNLIIVNSAPRPDGKKSGEQAVALRISGDSASFYNCKFKGFQDTVCDDKGDHFFKDCYIEGTVDFIFGEGRSIYLNSEIKVISGDPVAYIVAHARKNADGVGGYSFVHCKVTGTGKIAYLARAWMEAARTVYAYCTLSDVVHPEGFADHKSINMQKTVYFGEYRNTGPGASIKGRVKFGKQLTDKEAETFTSLEYIDAPKWLLPPPKV